MVLYSKRFLVLFSQILTNVDVGSQPHTSQYSTIDQVHYIFPQPPIYPCQYKQILLSSYYNEKTSWTGFYTTKLGKMAHQ